MGYRLAGCTVVGAVEVDPKVAAVYERNLGKRPHVAKIQDFRLSDDATQYEDNLDVLDGSPPCTLFSMTRRGGRAAAEELWSSDVQLREGGVTQRVNDLFFELVALAERLRPKVVIAENVRGMIMGNARGYAKQVLEDLRRIGYRPQLFLLDASRMGVPQRRERVFFVASREDLDRAPLDLDFREPPIRARDALLGLDDDSKRGLMAGTVARRLWPGTRPGQTLGKSIGKPGSMFNHIVLDPLRPSPTIPAVSPLYHWQEPRELTLLEKARLQSFPDDYRFERNGEYVVGMSVPPLMIERIARRVQERWL